MQNIIYNENYVPNHLPGAQQQLRLERINRGPVTSSHKVAAQCPVHQMAIAIAMIVG